MSDPQREPERVIADLIAPDILALLDEAPESVAAETEEMHPADLADIAEALPRDAVKRLLEALPPARAADILEYLSEEVRVSVLEGMPAEDAAEIVTQMTPDDRADIIEELEESTADDILSEFPREAREETERLLAYEPDEAGGIMTTEFISVPEDVTAEMAVQSVRVGARSGRREALYTIYAVDAAGRLTGVVSLQELLAAPDGVKISELERTEVVTVPPNTHRQEVARIVSDYDLLAVPVVDENNRLLGVVTVDDVIDAIVEEQTEDAQKLGAMQPLDEPYLNERFWSLTRKRAGWLCALFIGEMLTATAMGYFEGALAKALVLSLFIPLIVSSGGNSGSQATSLIIRSLALREIELKDWARVARRELLSGVVLGGILGTIGMIRIAVWQAGFQTYGPHWFLLALTVGIALVGVVIFGSFVGAMLPFLLQRMGLDPASASAPFVATLVDVTGLVIYFSVAILLLRGTLL